MEQDDYSCFTVDISLQVCRRRSEEFFWDKSITYVMLLLLIKDHDRPSSFPTGGTLPHIFHSFRRFCPNNAFIWQLKKWQEKVGEGRESQSKQWTRSNQIPDCCHQLSWAPGLLSELQFNISSFHYVLTVTALITVIILVILRLPHFVEDAI